MAINIQTSTQYQGVIEESGTFQDTGIIRNQIYSSLSSRPSASDFGVGTAQIDDKIYLSNGKSWTTLTNDALFYNHKPGFVMIGDSTLALGNSGGSCTIAASGTTATVTRSGHGLNRGAVFVMHSCTEPEFNGLFEVATYVSSSVFTYTLATTATVANATGTPAITVQQRIKDSEQVSLANHIAGNPGLYLGNFAYGGSKTSALQSQLNLALDSTKNLWLREPDIIFCSIGINDAINDIALATTQANVLEMIDRVYTAGKRLVLFTQMPLNQAYASWTVERLQVSRQYNEWLIALAKTDNRFELLPANSVLRDPANLYGDWISGYTVDGIHPSKPGSRAMAEVLATQFWSKIVYTDDRILTNLLSNPTLTGTTGTKSGTGSSGNVADGFVQNAAGGGSQTVVGAKTVAQSGQTEAQAITITAAAALDAGEFYIDLHSTLTAERWYAMKVTIRVVGTGNVRDLMVNIYTGVDTILVPFGCLDAFENVTFNSSYKEFTVETPPVKLITGASRFRPYIRCRMFDASAVTVHISDLSVFRVDR